MKNGRLKPLENYNGDSGPLVAVILDGIGIGSRDESDGVFVSHTPVLDRLFKEPLFMELKAHGTAVGLPSDDDMGNSEVGHNALGAGRIFSQGAKLVNDAFKSGSVFSGQSWKAIAKRCTDGGTLHLIGLVSDGNVHSHTDHLYGLLKGCSENKIDRVRIHGLLDGRDVGARSALDYFGPLEEKCADYRRLGYDFRIASGGGRMVTTMDRYEADWRIVEKGWKTHVRGEGRFFQSATEAISTYYREDPEVTDQYMDSFVIADENGPVGRILDGDAVVLFNFRGDRAIEISRAFDEADFSEFDRKIFPDVFFAGMMQYDGDAHIPNHYLVEPPRIDKTLSEYLCETGICSYAVSETQKFGHVTYFWNGNKSGYIDENLEKYVEISSDRVPFDQRPWMKAAEITDEAIEAIRSNRYRFIRLNYPNGDMVGHTGNPEAVRIAVETLDLCLGRLIGVLKRHGGTLMVTADHGNADCMWIEKNGTRQPMVAHTRNPVPFIVKLFTDKNSFEPCESEDIGLTNVAATICVLLGFQPPSDYRPSLLKLAGSV
ncbi:MAG: 2,3-bisphosphoglycerate-independent phosphoglycerate mutase [Desulfocapsaceae bacterium]|jgi:2,3-bisphosphoglycerate-independent phosphoglycerate mutase|nr:2,3-bisphosphoglycerate-independent phosphoglycerate mutase [Desulfocapsaceae bacterium]